MTDQAGARRMWRLSSASPLFVAALSAFCATGCTDPDTFVPIPDFAGPAGAIEGTLTYAGPPPCTEKGRIVGAAAILAFDTTLLPPPEGIGTSAGSIDIVPGETLFASVREKLVFDKDGARRCPDVSAPDITASATWSIAPLPPATYQIRGFYDRDGDFDPAFSIANLPTAGDVGGGAIDNAAAVLGGASPIYTEIQLGVPDASGKLVIPDTGSYVYGVGVTLGLPLPLERPVFYPSEVKDTTSTANKDPKKVILPADFQFTTFGASDASFIRIVMTAGVPDTETKAGAATPFFLPVGDPAKPPVIFMGVEDVNHDGVVDANDHVPESALLPSLYPIAVFSKLVAGDKIHGQTNPRVIMQGLTIYKNLLLTTTKLPTDPMVPAFQSLEPEVTVALRPAAACMDPKDIKKPGVLVVSHETDAAGTKIIADEATVKAGLQAQFGRPFSIVYGCLPEGDYAMNLVYPTGQAWTVPNEAGVCASSEPMSADGKSCVTPKIARARLVSQDALVTVGPAKDKSYCTKNPTPALCKAPVTSD